MESYAHIWQSIHLLKSSDSNNKDYKIQKLLVIYYIDVRIKHQNSMQNQNHLAKLILRIGFGGFMLTHGIPKMMKLFAGGEIQFADPIGLGPTISLVLTVFAEVICAAMILVGFKTKWAAYPLIFTMIVAAFVVHADDPFGKKEFALLYAVGYLAISLLGAGKYSIDKK